MAPQTEPTTRRSALALLGLPETATRAEMVHAYRRLVRATHPDTTGRTDPEAAHEFAAINHAYQLLAHAAQAPEEDPAHNRADDPAEETVGASRPQRLGDESDPSREAWSPPACRLPPEGVPAFRPSPPIVAGPTVVTPLPEQHRRHRRWPR